MSNKEARLVCVAWLPKATVQAAVGGTPLDVMILAGHGPEAVARGRLVLMLSVVVILLTAPVGALGIAVFGPLWLQQDAPVTKEPEDPVADHASEDLAPSEGDAKVSISSPT